MRVWLEVTNPNTFGLTLSTVNATLALDGSRAATGEFPLGLPLGAGQQSVVPLDLSIDFADVPGLAGVVRQVATGRNIQYQRAYAPDTRRRSGHPLKSLLSAFE